MCKGRSSVHLALSVALILSLFVGQCYGQLQLGFYKGKCKTKNISPRLGLFGGSESEVDVDVEKFVAEQVRLAMADGKIDPAALLRMQFHDCFVKGCDASILVNGMSTEKNAGPNLSVRGYEFIDKVKDLLEEKCSNVVSCADIIVMATKEAVALSTRGGVSYSVRTGRRDGNESLATNVNLPPPDISVSDSIKVFENKGLNASDMVYLIGAHTIGITHCSFVKDRLYNFSGSGKSDPNMEPKLRDDLKFKCPQNETGNDIVVGLDQATPTVIDEKFFDQLKRKRGILQIDQDLAMHKITKITVNLINEKGFKDFASEFGKAMVKLGEVEVLTGENGQIRRSCGSIN